MTKDKNISAAIKWGLIIGLVYVLILFIRWNTATDFMKFGLFTLAGFFIVITLMVIEARQVKKMNGGYIDIKSLFKTLFISVLIFEFLYSLYNYIHLVYIDPEIGERMKQGMQEVFNKYGDKVSDSDQEKALEKIGDIKKSIQLPQLIKGYLSSVAISGIFALLIAAIVKKNKPVFQENL